MGGRVIGSSEKISASLGIHGGRIRKAVNDQIEKEALGVLALAKAMVPREHGHMESAIKIERASMRRIWIIYVDEKTPADGPSKDETGRYTVGAYLRFLHEGRYKLGPESLAKQAGQNVKVGRKFIERALKEQLRRGAIRRIEAEARKANIL